METYTTPYHRMWPDLPGGKVRAISRGDLARGDITCDPARSRQIPWFRVCLRESAKRRDYARSRVHIINARVCT